MRNTFRTNLVCEDINTYTNIAEKINNAKFQFIKYVLFKRYSMSFRYLTYFAPRSEIIQWKVKINKCIISL